MISSRNDDFGAFAAGWRDWLARITPAAADELPRSMLSIYALAEDLCRIDIVVEPVSPVAASPHRRRLAVINRDGLHRMVPAAEPGSGPDKSTITAMITEFWRSRPTSPP